MDSALAIDPVHRVSVKVRDLTVSVRSKKHDEENNSDTKILDNVSFDLEQGEIMAIMGGSGSGKTTLLNTLSQRINIRNKKLQFNGSINYLCQDTITSSYMLQSDVFIPGLSVWEYLEYCADLKLSISRAEKTDLITSLLTILDIDHVKHQRVMTFLHSSDLSGGERRRVSLAVQLLNRPALLFLDEPTTGLDASSSLKLVQGLRRLSADLGVTIVLSIHQPRPEVSLLFDKICLLTRGGRVVYYGSLVNSFSYFNELQLLPQDIKNSHIMDFIMSLSVKDTSSRAKEQETVRKIDSLVAHWRTRTWPAVPNPQSFKSNVKVFDAAAKPQTSFLNEVAVLTRRTFVLSCRDSYSLLSMIGLSLFTAVVCGWMFYKPPPDLAGIRSYTSSLYVMLEIVGFVPLFIEIERLWETDGLVFFREYTEGYVSIPGFILSRKLGKVLVEDIPFSFPFAAITYFMWGLRLSEDLDGDYTPHYFLNYLAITVLVYLVGMASALFCFSFSSDFAVCAMVQNIFYQLQNSACGYFVNASTMPVYVRWTKYICYFWYAFGALTSNQYSGWRGACPSEGSGDGSCEEYTGAYQLAVLGFPENWVAAPIGILAVWCVGFYILAAVGLKLRNYDVSMAKQKKPVLDETEDEDEAKNENSAQKLVSKPPESKELDPQSHDNISIQLDNISLTANSGVIRTTSVRILDEITASFAAKKVNVIMGPSGSGKTTLLNLISNRLSNRFDLLGRVKLNFGQEIELRQLSKISSYVRQFDNSLIPHLTARETFYYQALLRLPLSEHPRIPEIIARLIREMGLVDCADTPVGSEALKGISGGERRRVSIGVQLLSRPKILFLDEPTSGLDSSTSVSILKLLEKLTLENGTTIITTIHQPSDAMFDRFGSLLLLAKGGRVVFNGASGSIEEYFVHLGLHKPQEVQIADYILDTVSQGMEEDGDDAKARIDELVRRWREGQQEHEPKQLPSSNHSIDLNNYRLNKLPFGIRFRTIFRRQVLSSIRSRDALIARATQVLALGIIHALYFAPLRNSEAGVSNRLGLIQEVLNFYFIGLINNFALYPVERELFYQEYKDGIYNSLEFQLSYFINESVVELVTCLVFSAFVVFVVGMPRNAGMYFSMFFVCFVAINCGESLGIMVNSIFDHLGLAINVLSTLMIMAIFMGGTMSLYMPVVFRAFNYVNPLKYAVGICAELSLRGQEFDCGAAGCSLDTGTAVLKYYGLESYLPGFFGGIVACFVVYRVISLWVCWVKVRYFV